VGSATSIRAKSLHLARPLASFPCTIVRKYPGTHPAYPCMSAMELFVRDLQLECGPSQSEPEYWVIQRCLLPHANRCVQQLSVDDVTDAYKDWTPITHSTTWAISTKIRARWPRRRKCTSGRWMERRKHGAPSIHRHSTPSTTWAFSIQTRASWPRRRRCTNGKRTQEQRLNMEVNIWLEAQPILHKYPHTNAYQ